jgi:hypothetical protein
LKDIVTKAKCCAVQIKKLGKRGWNVQVKIFVVVFETGDSE